MQEQEQSKTGNIGGCMFGAPFSRGRGSPRQEIFEDACSGPYSPGGEKELSQVNRLININKVKSYNSQKTEG